MIINGPNPERRVRVGHPVVAVRVAVVAVGIASARGTPDSTFQPTYKNIITVCSNQTNLFLYMYFYQNLTSLLVNQLAFSNVRFDLYTDYRLLLVLLKLLDTLPVNQTPMLPLFLSHPFSSNTISCNQEK